MKRKHLPATFFGAAAIALATGGLVAPAVSQAQYDQKSFNKCADVADKRFVSGQTNQTTWQDEYKFCCTRAGGQWDSAKNTCVETATAQTAPTPLPGQVATGPGQATLPGTRAN